KEKFIRRQDIKKKLKQLKERKLNYEAIQKQVEQSADGQVSVTDPESKALIINKNIVEVSYNTQTAVDAQNNLLVHYEATNRNDAKALHKAATEAKEILQSEELTVLADKGYHNGEQLSQCEKENIVTVVAYREQPSVKHLDKKYLVENFRYNKKNDTYTCPQGHTLRSNGNWYKKNHRSEKRKTGGITEVKHYKTPHCKNCPVLNQCTKNTRGRGRVIERSKHQDAVDRNNHRVKTQRELYNRRQTICEHPFGTIKRAWGYTYTLLKGLKKVDGEFGIIFTCYNLRRTISIMGVEKLLKKLKKWKPDYKKAMKSRGNNFLFTKTASLSRITALQNFSYQLAA
ncbi:MAG: transposase, partial [Elusimicrobiota bacterium]